MKGTKIDVVEEVGQTAIKSNYNRKRLKLTS
jgi:hypothetical protein